MASLCVPPVGRSPLKHEARPPLVGKELPSTRKMSEMAEVAEELLLVVQVYRVGCALVLLETTGAPATHDAKSLALDEP